MAIDVAANSVFLVAKALDGVVRREREIESRGAGTVALAIDGDSSR